MNSEDREELIEKFGKACANIDSVLEKLNTYGQEIVDEVSDTEDTQEKCGAAIMRAVINTAEARHNAVAMNLHDPKKYDPKRFRLPLTLLRSQIIAMQTAFDEANDETGMDRLDFIEKAIRQATFAKRNCDDIYTALTTMSVVSNNKGNNKVNNKVNKGGSRKHKKRTQRVRTHRKKTQRVRARK
jgi:hypothetical protein